MGISFSKRITPISISIDIKRLENESRKFLYIGLVLGVIFEGLVGAYISSRKTEKQVTERSEYRIIKLRIIEPRMIKPYVLRRRIQKDYLYRQRFVFRMPSKKFSLKLPSTTLEIPEPDFHLGIDFNDLESLALFDILDDSLLIEEQNAFLPKYSITLKNQVFFDTGRYKSELIIPPDNKMAVQGFTHIPFVVGEKFAPPDTLRSIVADLADALNRYTNIYATPDEGVSLYSDKIFEYPFIYITNDGPFRFMLTQEESWNLGHYIVNGGFVIIDNGLPQYRFSRTQESANKMMSDVFSTISKKIKNHLNPHGSIAGGDYKYQYEFKPLKKDHELFQCFFDFENGAPPLEYSDEAIINGIYLKRRLVGLYIDGYGVTWKNKNNRAQLKMGVNMVVYALTRKKGRYILTSSMESIKSGKWIYSSPSPIKSW